MDSFLERHISTARTFQQCSQDISLSSVNSSDKEFFTSNDMGIRGTINTLISKQQDVISKSESVIGIIASTSSGDGMVDNMLDSILKCNDHSTLVEQQRKCKLLFDMSTAKLDMVTAEKERSTLRSIRKLARDIEDSREQQSQPIIARRHSFGIPLVTEQMMERPLIGRSLSADGPTTHSFGHPPTFTLHFPSNDVTIDGVAPVRAPAPAPTGSTWGSWMGGGGGGGAP